MKNTTRKLWLAAALTAAFLAVLTHRWIVDHPSPDPLNYTQIEPGLYLGARVPEPPPGTQAVLNLCQTPDPYRLAVQQWEPIPDAPPAPSLDWLQKRVDFIATQRRTGQTVFVHCDAGISRSGLVVAAYLMQRDHLTRDEALRTIRTQREIVRPNAAFMVLLLDWEKSLKIPEQHS